MGVLRSPVFVVCALTALGAIGCTSSTEPPPTPQPTTVQAVTPVNQTGAAGEAVGDPPAVEVRDQNNNPMQGITVTFAVTGGGAISQTSVVTEGDGIARLASWTLGPGAQTNTVTATVAGLPAVTFTAEAFVVATSLSAASPTFQFAEPGTAAPGAPRVIVRDANNAPLAGITVNFAVTGGAGTVNPASVVTGADGVAQVTSWTLGAAAGANTLTATIPGVNPVVFRASTCTIADIALVATVNESLSETTSCRFPTGEYANVYRLSLAETRVVHIMQSSTSFDTYVVLLTSTGVPVAENDDLDEPPPATPADHITDSELRAFVPAGTYLVAATSFLTNTTGAYTLQLQEGDSNVTGCPQTQPTFPFIRRGVTTQQSLATTDCLDDVWWTDFWFVFLAAGETVTIEMNSTEVDAFLFLLDPNDELVLNDDKSNQTTDAELTHTAAVAGYHFFGSSSSDAGEVGAYTLIVRAGVAAQAQRIPAAHLPTEWRRALKKDAAVAERHRLLRALELSAARRSQAAKPAK